LVRMGDVFADKLEEVTTAERSAARSAKPWSVQMQHARQKADKKDRTTEAAKKHVQSVKDEFAAIKEKLAKAESDYHDRKIEQGKCQDEIAVLFSTKPDADSDDEGDDSEDDADYTRDDMRAEIARLQSEVRDHAVALAEARDDRTERAKKQPASSVVSYISIASGGEGGTERDEPPIKHKRFALGATATKTKLSRSRRSRSRGCRIFRDDEADAIMDASGTGKQYPA
jgi:hypothetical protein